MDDPRLTPARPEIAAKYLEGKGKAARFVAGEVFEVVESIAPLREMHQLIAVVDGAGFPSALSHRIISPSIAGQKEQPVPGGVDPDLPGCLRSGSPGRGCAEGVRTPAGRTCVGELAAPAF